MLCDGVINEVFAYQSDVWVCLTIKAGGGVGRVGGGGE